MQIAHGAPGRSQRRLVRDTADGRPRPRRHRHVDGELALKNALAVEHLDASIATVGHTALGIDCDAMRGVELSGTGAAVTPGLYPIAVLVDLGDTGID
jgi:hypothetical protein